VEEPNAGIIHTTKQTAWIRRVGGDSAHAAPAVSVVVPTLNEAGNISRLLEEVFAACGPGIEVVVVDDGSTDGTRD